VTSEGLIGNRLASDHSSGTLVEVNCETDFVARTPDFQELVRDVLTEIDNAGDAATEDWLRNPNGPVATLVAGKIATLRENMAVPRFVRYAGQGYVGQYIHLGGKIGVQVEFGGVTPEVAVREEFATLVRDTSGSTSIRAGKSASRWSSTA
jgi:elongation factor Ts